MAGPQLTAKLFSRHGAVWATFGHAGASLVGMLLVQRVFLDMLLPHLLPALEAMFASSSRFMAVSNLCGLAGAIGFWGFGSIFAVPALVGCKRWKIQPLRSLDRRMLLQSLPLMLFNSAAGGIFAAVLLTWGLPDVAFDWHECPGVGTLVRDTAVFMLVNEVLFFYMHRFLHVNKRAYQTIHKIHHKWTAPISFAAVYAHPLEVLFGNALPLLVGPLLCRSHISTATVWLFAYQVHTTCTHSGFWFCDDNGMHDEHHAKFNVNFGVHGIMDHLYGTFKLPEASVTAAKQA